MDLLPPPFVFSVLVATAYGAGFHLVFGGNRNQLLLYLLAGWLGFALGQLVGALMNINVLNIGPIHTLTASIGCWLALGTARWLAARNLTATSGGRSSGG
jgi:uncharacterized membrane protein YjjP (DUF1212 family)